MIAFGEDADDGQSADRAVRQDVQRLDHLQDRLRLHLSPAKGERGVKTDVKAERNPTFARSFTCNNSSTFKPLLNGATR